MGILDALLGRFKKPTQARRFNAAQMNRLTNGWTSMNVSADSDVRMDLEALRARSRDLANNNDYARKFLQMVETNVVGPDGFILRSMAAKPDGSPDLTDRNTLETNFAAWSEAGACDVTGRYAFADLTRMVARAVARDGEALVRRIRNKNYPFGYKQQLLDIDRLDVKFNDDLANGNRIVMSVEYAPDGSPVAYHMLTRHPGDNLRGNTVAGAKRDRIPAEEVFHLFRPDRPEQTRGVPWMHTAMLRLQMLGAYEEAALVAARTGAAKMGFFTSPDGDASVLAGDVDDSGNFISDADPGTFEVLPKGYSFQSFNPDYPQANYDTFVKACLRGIASGLGVAYNTLSNDLEGVNFSSIRSGTLEERDNWMVIQKWLISAYLIPTFNDWLDCGLLSGAITSPNGFALPAAKLGKFKAHTWQGRRWSWVDPLKDIEANLAAIHAGINSPQHVAAQMGLDLDDVMEALASANERARALGLPAYCEPAPTPAAPPSADSSPQVVAAKAHADALVRTAEINREAAIASRPVPPPAIPPISLTMNQDEVVRAHRDGTAALEAAIVTLQERIDAMQIVVNVPEQPAPVVNVEPVINVAAPNVEATFEATVQPAAIELTMPQRKTVTEFQHDAEGNVTKATQVETSI